MEEKKENTSTMYKVRSYLSCFNEGVKLPTQNVLSLLGFLWPSISFSAVVAALWALFCNSVTVPLAEWISSPGTLMLNIPFWTIFILSFLSLASASLYAGQLVSAVRHYSSKGTLASLSLKGSLLPMLVYSSKAFVLFFISLAVIALTVAASASFLGMASVWTWIILSVVLLALIVPYNMVICDNLLNENNSTLLHSFARIKDGYRFWVAFFIISLYSGVIILLLSLVAWLPSGILAYTGYLSYLQISNGDATDLPGYMSVFTVIMFVISSSLCYIFCWIRVFPMAYLYASIETRNEEERIYKENNNIS